MMRAINDLETQADGMPSVGMETKTGSDLTVIFRSDVGRGS